MSNDTAPELFPGRRRPVQSERVTAVAEDAPIDLLLEFVLSGLFDIVVELLIHVFNVPRDRRRREHPVPVALALFFGGCAAGALVTWVLPTRLLGTPAVPGASLVVSPVLNGALMHYYGAWTTRAGRHASFAATFWGGAVFAFGFAVVRLLMVAER